MHLDYPYCLFTGGYNFAKPKNGSNNWAVLVGA